MDEIIPWGIIGVLSFEFAILTIFIAIVSAILILILLPIMLKILSKIGTYRRLKSQDDQNYSHLYGDTSGESFINKFFSIFLLNIIIGFSLLISLIYTFNTISSLFSDLPKTTSIQLLSLNLPSPMLNSSTHSPVMSSFALSLFLIPAILFSLRILSNPTKKFNFLKLYYMSITEDKKKVVDFKKEVISLYSSFIIITFVVLYASILYTAIKWDISTSFNVLLSIIPPINIAFFVFLAIELFSIFVLTFIGEYYLMKCEPIDMS